MIDLNKTGIFNKKQESKMNFQSLFNTSHQVQVESIAKIIISNQVLIIIKLEICRKLIMIDYTNPVSPIVI
jgi:hypothetical protein